MGDFLISSSADSIRLNPTYANRATQYSPDLAPSDPRVVDKIYELSSTYELAGTSGIMHPPGLLTPKPGRNEDAPAQADPAACRNNGKKPPLTAGTGEPCFLRNQPPGSAPCRTPPGTESPVSQKIIPPSGPRPSSFGPLLYAAISDRRSPRIIQPRKTSIAAPLRRRLQPPHRASLSQP